jgi:hypothetical protein
MRKQRIETGKTESESKVRKIFSWRLQLSLKDKFPTRQGEGF